MTTIQNLKNMKEVTRMTNYQKMLDSFEYINLRERYTMKAVRNDEKGWPKNQVTVTDNAENRTVATYVRNYTVYDTFDPFRWWVNDEWRHYALYSADYTTWSIMDLQTGETIHTSKGGTFAFCPKELKVPDFRDYYDEDDIGLETDDWVTIEMLETAHKRRTFGFVKGTVWADDWAMKLETIDIAGVFEGEKIETSEPSFGYFIIEGKINETIDFDYFFDDEYSKLKIQTPISFKMDRNKTTQSSFYGDVPKNFTIEDWQNKDKA